MSLASVDQDHLKNVITLALDTVDETLPLPEDDRPKPGSAQFLAWQDRLNLRREAFAQALAVAIEHDIT